MTTCAKPRRIQSADLFTGQRALIQNLDVCNLTVNGSFFGNTGTTVHGASTLVQAAAVLLPAEEISETLDVYNGNILQSYPTAFVNPASAWTLGAPGFIAYNLFAIAPPTAVGAYVRWANVWVAKAGNYQMHVSYLPVANGTVFQVVIDGVAGPTLDTSAGTVLPTVLALPIGALAAGNHDVRIQLAMDGLLGNVGVFGRHVQLVESA